MAGPQTFVAGQVLTAAELTLVQGWWGTFSGTTSGSGTNTVTHGAPFTPSAVQVTVISPSTGGKRGYPYVTAVSSTTFSLQWEYVAGGGGNMNAVAVSIFYTCLP